MVKQAALMNGREIKVHILHPTNRLIIFRKSLFFTILEMKFYMTVLQPKSLYISRAVSNFYGTEIEIWAALGWMAVLKKKI